jgi:predicted porin
MKKSLIALAALAATASFAQSSVVISGAVDVAYATRNATAADGSIIGKSTGISEGQNTANRINFAMTEDLGGGLKAGAMFENGLNITNGALFTSRAAAAGIQAVNAGSTSGEIPVGAYGTSTNRQAYVFTNGGFGEIRAGWTRTNAYEQSTYSGYLVGQEQYGSLLHTLGVASTFGGTRGNGLTWITPKYANFNATLQYGGGTDREVTTTDAASGLNGATNATLKRTGIKIDYNNGPLNLTYGRTNVTALTVAGSAASPNFITASGNTVFTVQNIFGAPATVSAANYKSNLNQFTGSYEIGALKVTGQYLNGKKDNASGTDYNYKASILGAIYTMGNYGLFASVGNGSIAAADTGAKTQNINQQQIGVRYAMSKRTTIYAMTGTSKDNGSGVATNAAAYSTIVLAGSGTANIAKASVTAIGMAHAF